MDPFSGALFAGLGVMLMLMAVLPSVLMLVALVYVALRVRDAKADHPDPELGLKTAYWLLYTIGILVLHFGLTVLVSHWLQSLELTGPNPALRPQPMRGGFGGMPGAPADDSWSAASRTGWALVVAGGAMAAAFYLIGALGTRDREWPYVRRLFTGSRIAVAGLIVAIAFTFLFVMQFQKEIPGGGVYEAALAALAVWLPSLAIHVFLFRWGGTPPYHLPRPVRPIRPRFIPREPDEDDIPEVAPERPPEEVETEQIPRRRRPRDED